MNCPDVLHCPRTTNADPRVDPVQVLGVRADRFYAPVALQQKRHREPPSSNWRERALACRVGVQHASFWMNTIVARDWSQAASASERLVERCVIDTVDM